MSLLIVEAIPKTEKLQEGHVLNEFIKMTSINWPRRFRRFANKYRLLTYFENENHYDFEFIHFSGHGTVEGNTSFFECPRGSIAPDEFPEDCFIEQTVALSACELGKAAFVRPFMRHTGAKGVIAPLKEIPFMDACVWFVNYYYFLLEHHYAPGHAFNRVQRSLQSKIKGAFRFWK